MTFILSLSQDNCCISNNKYTLTPRAHYVKYVPGYGEYYDRPQKKTPYLTTEFEPTKFDKNRIDELKKASETGGLDRVKTLFTARDIETKTIDYCARAAAHNNQFEIVKFYAEKIEELVTGFDRDTFYKQVLKSAACSNDVKTTKYCFQQLGSSREISPTTLGSAAFCGSLEVFKYLDEIGMSFNTNHLSIAVIHGGNTDIMDYMIDRIPEDDKSARYSAIRSQLKWVDHYKRSNEKGSSRGSDPSNEQLEKTKIHIVNKASNVLDEKYTSKLLERPSRHQRLIP